MLRRSVVLKHQTAIREAGRYTKAEQDELAEVRRARDEARAVWEAAALVEWQVARGAKHPKGLDYHALASLTSAAKRDWEEANTVEVVTHQRIYAAREGRRRAATRSWEDYVAAIAAAAPIRAPRQDRVWYSPEERAAFLEGRP